MTPFSSTPKKRTHLAADAFEVKIEEMISPTDFYFLDGDTTLRIRNGQIETATMEEL